MSQMRRHNVLSSFITSHHLSSPLSRNVLFLATSPISCVTQPSQRDSYSAGHGSRRRLWAPVLTAAVMCWYGLHTCTATGYISMAWQCTENNVLPSETSKTGTRCLWINPAPLPSMAARSSSPFWVGRCLGVSEVTLAALVYPSSTVFFFLRLAFMPSSLLSTLRIAAALKIIAIHAACGGEVTGMSLVYSQRTK
ncbi:hypothetical protein BD414DRAFT_12425 [Trametes punicea]|nr:hypothetical protein BD414DRAFT_12425 [Trametes punicea]